MKRLKTKLDSNAGYRWAIKVLDVLTYYVPMFAGVICLFPSHRMLSTLIFPLCVFIHWPRFGWRRRILSLVFWGLFFATLITPFDITFINYPGPPRFVRYLVGYPSLDGTLLLMQHEAVWGGCVRHFNEPEWVLVW